MWFLTEHCTSYIEYWVFTFYSARHNQQAINNIQIVNVFISFTYALLKRSFIYYLPCKAGTIFSVGACASCICSGEIFGAGLSK